MMDSWIDRRSIRTDDDNESIFTYDTLPTAVSSPDRQHLFTKDQLRPQSSQHRLQYAPSPPSKNFSRRLPTPHQPLPSLPALRPSSSRNALQQESYTSIIDNNLRFFPMPHNRSGTRMMRNLNIPDHDGFEFDEILETPPADIESKMEAAWEDASCIDSDSRPVSPSGGIDFSLSSTMTDKEDRFEVDALRRQVEQLQMALQLQSQQRELEMHLAAATKVGGREKVIHRRPSQVYANRMSRYSAEEEWSAPTSPPPTIPLPPNPASLRAGSVLNPAHSSAAAMLPQYHHQSSKSPHYHDSSRAYAGAGSRTTLERRQSELSQTSVSSASTTPPSLSTSQTLSEVREEGDIAAGEAARIEELNQKVEAMQRMIETLAGVNSVSHIPPSTASARNRAESIISATSTAPSTSNIVSKKGKLAAALGFSGKEGGKSSSSLDVSTRAAAVVTGGGGVCEEVSRVSWSRKRTEKVLVPKVKIRQAAGRGRMVIKEVSAAK